MWINFRYLNLHKNRFIICPKCGKRGFPTFRWVRNSYYPKIAALSITVYKINMERLKRNPSDSHAQTMVNIHKSFFRGKKYRGKSTKGLISGKVEDDFDKEQCYR